MSVAICLHHIMLSIEKDCLSALSCVGEAHLSRKQLQSTRALQASRKNSKKGATRDSEESRVQDAKASVQPTERHTQALLVRVRISYPQTSSRMRETEITTSHTI
jgi:hypothetical protein